VLVTFQKQYEEPSLDEGYDELVQIEWDFNGSQDEMQKWGMWLDF
jgi:bifunctional polynucleotide phosphatase/kinase